MLDDYNVKPKCYVADNASNQVLCNDMLVDWANDDSNSSHFRSVLPELNPSDDGGTSITSLNVLF